MERYNCYKNPALQIMPKIRYRFGALEEGQLAVDREDKPTINMQKKS